MTVRSKLALTVFATGIVTALLVIATVIYAFQRFEHETAYRRGTAFLGRVAANYDNLFDLHERHPEEFQVWLRNMVLFAPDTQLYLLDLDGTVLASSSAAALPPGRKVAIEPVLRAIGQPGAAYVMGDDPERMDADAVVAVQPVRRAVIRAADPVVGYLYLVLHTEQLPEGRWAALRMSVTRPALGLIAAVVAFTTLVAVLIIVSVTRPLQRLTDAVATVSQRGLDAGLPEGLPGSPGRPGAWPPVTRDEFGQLTAAFEMMLATLRRQWSELRRLDQFRREGVSNLSHDLRSPLTATVACLETLERRWADPGGAPDAADGGGGPAQGSKAGQDGATAATRAGHGGPAGTPGADRADDRRLVEIALRNTRNAARLVQSLGDLAKLDEPEFGLHPEAVDVGELLDDICIRFAERAAAQGVALRMHHGGEPAIGLAPSSQDQPGNSASAAAAIAAPAAGAFAAAASAATAAGAPAAGPPAATVPAAATATATPSAAAPPSAGAFALLDIELFERAVANLVDNALKFCPRGARITLTAAVRAGWVQVGVADTGPGIPAADLPHLFDRFFQSRHSVAPATGEGGRGLGLAIVKRIVELHGGTVAVTSVVGQGTQVSISVPAAAV